MGEAARKLVSAPGAPDRPTPFLLQPGPVRPARVGVVGYAAALQQNTGATWGAKSWAEGQERQARLADQTRHLADTLERNGIRARLPSELVMLGEVTGGASAAESWRPIRFLPAVAQRERKPVLNALKLWQRTGGGKRLRYAVVTSGERVPLGESGDGTLAVRQAQHTRAISRWAHEALRDYGVEVQFRATEMTVSAEGVHLHSNVLYRLAEKLPPERWSAFLAWSRQRLGAHWRDCGQVQSMDEVVKYALKPAELEGLDDAHVVWLYENLFGKKLCQPMGAFAQWLNELGQDRLKVAMVTDAAASPGERRKSRLKLVEKPRRDTKPKKRKEDGGESKLPEAEADAEDTADVRTEAETPAPQPMGENVLIARTLPLARFCPWSEPLSLVVNYTESPVTPDGVRRLELLRERRAEALKWWKANGAPAPEVALLAGAGARSAPLTVHTGSPTVQPEKVSPLPRRVVTVGDGVLVDGDTGEVLLDAPGRPPAPESGWVDEVVNAGVGEAERLAAERPGLFRELDRRLAADLSRHRGELAMRARCEAECRAWKDVLARNSATAALCSTAGAGRAAPPSVVDARDALRPDATPRPPRADTVKSPSQGTRLHVAGQSPAEEAGVEGDLTVSSTVAPLAEVPLDAGCEWWESVVPPW